MAPIGAKSKGKGARDGRSRNTTPMSSGSADQAQSNTSANSLQSGTMTYEDLIERHCRSNSPPPSQILKKIAESLRHFSDVAKTRSENCDRGMREFSKRKREFVELTRDQEIAEREAEDDRKDKQRKPKLKKERDEDRPLAVGAHSVTRQDGLEATDAASADHGNDDEGSQAEGKSADAAPASPSSSSSSLSSHQPRPAPAVPQYQTFGPDPSTYDDPTVYHLREIDEDMVEDEKKEILGVSYYPHDDLHDLTPGTPPDRDFSNAKPPNQVSATQFANYLEPYVRPLTEEDIAFLKERGDRISPFMIPRRGLRGYKELWAEEDGSNLSSNVQNSQDQPANNQPNGSIDQMNDDVAETSEVSTGPMLARLLGVLRPERRAPLSEANPTAQMNGDTSASNVVDGEMNQQIGNDEQQSRPLPPSTYFAESNQPGWKTQGPKLDYTQMEDRVKTELRHIGFLSEDAEPDYEGHHDDEVAARLRYLQQELHHISILNGARKARVLELVEERMAQQEYSTISEDLDTQLNQAYLKRHRNIGKGKSKLKKPGGPGSASNNASSAIGVSKPGIGEPIRSLMERRNQWNNLIGPVVDFGKTTIPQDTIFDEENMNKHIAREKESWSEAQEQS